ncbi:Uncharacterized protein dnm_062720 [Desulfonema magnum]|uniref:Uncharacterized protein n=1 Tax=Desulfonema magnum TaxID=45655 RepID=A0A975BR75_9BACT|nr:Uncharacterized protein dnm_062720 [Desulfonema magnum]
MTVSGILYINGHDLPFIMEHYCKKVVIISKTDLVTEENDNGPITAK